jgi:hypothetical protein
MILEKRRELRRREQDEDMGYVTPPRNPPHPVGRPSARRSMSTGDAEDLQALAMLAAMNPPGTSVLPNVVVTEERDPLAESIARELRKLRGSTKNVSLGYSRVLKNAQAIQFSRDITYVNIVRLSMPRRTQIKFRTLALLAMSITGKLGGQFVALQIWYGCIQVTAYRD